MSGFVALVLCLGLIGYLLWTDRRGAKDVSAAVWIPFLWMFFAGSRYAGQWLALGAPTQMSAEDYSEGSPLDRAVFLVLVTAGIVVLLRRRINWESLTRENKWVFAYFAFALMSVLWSDEPVVALKRWTKGLGNVVMALVLLTERRPIAALGVTMRRLGYVLLPLSVLFIRFYPDLGRTYHMGQPMFTGVAFTKNSLGQLCLLISTYLLWELIFFRRALLAADRGPPLVVYAICLAMAGWLLFMADSATCNALVGVVGAMLAVASIPAFRRDPRRLVIFWVLTITAIAVMEFAFDIREEIIRLLGRAPDLTTRAPIWDMLIQLAPNHWIGAGYESFWTGDRMLEVWRRLGSKDGGIIQAHNGYIETYLNLGAVGLSLLILAILGGGLQAINSLRESYGEGLLRLLFIAVAVIYNYTEAAYKPVHNVFVLLLFAMIHVRVRQLPKAPTRALRSPKPQYGRKPLGGRVQLSMETLSESASPLRHDRTAGVAKISTWSVGRGGDGQ